MAGIKGPQLPHQPSTAPTPAKTQAPTARGPKQVSGPKRRTQLDADSHEEEHGYADRHDPDEGHKGRGTSGQPQNTPAQGRLAGAFAPPGSSAGLNMRSLPRQMLRPEGRMGGVEGAGHAAQPSHSIQALADRALNAYPHASPERQANARAALGGPWVG